MLSKAEDGREEEKDGDDARTGGKDPAAAAAAEEEGRLARLLGEGGRQRDAEE